MRTTFAILVLVLAVFVAPPARAEFCLDFTGFCDGLELNFNGPVITGWWRNYNCDGDDAPMIGFIGPLSDLPCHPGSSRHGNDPQWPAKAFFACIPEAGCTVANDEWYYVFDGMHGTVDLGQAENRGTPPFPGACWFDEIPYTLLEGPCRFLAPESGKSMLSTIQAGG